MAEAHANLYWSTIVETDGLVRLIRSGAAIEDLDDYRSSMDTLVAWLEERITPGMVCLIDSRDSIPRNDERFEAITREYRKQVRERFAKTAVLLRTQIGVLQMQRFDREEQTHTAVFHDEHDALAWLRAAG